MPIEALYPYAIMTYSALVTILAVYLWKLTNLNVDGTRSNIEKQVATAVVDIKGQVVEMKTQVNDALANADFKAVSAQLEDLRENIPDFDQDVVMARLDALETRLPDMIGTHISMAIKGVKAEEGKAIAAYVETLGIEGLTEEAKEAAVAKLSIKQRAAYELMTMKVPPKTKRAHPMSTTVFEQSRGLVAQYIIESDHQASGNVHYVEGGSGEGHRPGLRR